MQIHRTSSPHPRDLEPTREPGPGAAPRPAPAEGSTPCPPDAGASASPRPDDSIALPATPDLDGSALLMRGPHAGASAPHGPAIGSLGQRLLASLVTALPLPGPQLATVQASSSFFGIEKAPPEVPDAIWKASGKNAEVAALLATRIRALRCSDEERAAVVPTAASLLKTWGTKLDLAAALDAVDGRPDVPGRFAAYAALLDASRNPKQAPLDLQTAEEKSTAHSVPLSEAATTLAALRRRDPEIGSYYPRYLDLTPAADFVLGSPDPALRADRRASIEALCGLGRDLPGALDQATVLDAFPCPPDQRSAVRESWFALIKPWRTSSDAALLGALKLAAAAPDPRAALTDLATLVDATRRPAVAATDLDLAIASATERGIERTEGVAILKSLREHDPNREDGYQGLAEVRPALAHVLKGDSRVARDARLQALLALQSQGRTVDQVTPLAHRVEALKCSSVGQAAIAGDLRKALSEYASRNDPSFMAALNAVDGSEAPRLWQGFRTLLDVSKRPATAASDVALARDRAQARSLDFGEVVTQLEILRRADPNVGEGYYDLAKPEAILDETLALPDAASRTRAMENLVSLQKKGRDAEAVRPFLHEIVGLWKGPHAASADAVLETMQALLDSRSSRADAALLGGLREATASSNPRRRMEQFAAHVKRTGASDVALGDLQMIRELAGTSGVAFDELMPALARLREADPAKGDSYGTFAPARPAMEILAGAPSASAREQEIRSLLALQVQDRTLSHATPLLQALHGLRTGPSASHEAAVQAALVPILAKYPARNDDVFVALLRDLANVPDATLELQRYVSLLTLLKRPAQALEDLRLARRLAEEHQCDEGPVVDAILGLRKADPNLSEPYYDVADIRPTLESLVSRTASAGASGQVTSLGDAATHFMSFQRKGRDAESAHRHAAALDAIPVAPAARPALEQAYIGLLETYPGRYDDFLLDVLKIAATTTDATAALGHFSSLRETSKDGETARSDLKQAIEKGARHDVPVAESVALAATLRKGDPVVGQSYGGYQSIDAALEWVCQASDAPARSDRAQRLASLQAIGRTLDEGVVHEQRLDTLQLSDAERASVREAYRGLLVLFPHHDDRVLMETLDVVDGLPDASGLMRAASELAKASQSTVTTVVDLRALLEAVRRTHLPVDEVSSLLARVRGGDPDQGYSYEKPTELSPALVPVLAGPDPAARQARAASLVSLWAQARGTERATQGLEWILATPPPDGDLEDATRTMGTLLRHTKSESRSDDVRAIYQRMQEVASTEKVPLWRRLLRKGSVYEATVWKTFAYSSDASRALALIGSLERHGFKGEDVGDTWNRVTTLLRAVGDRNLRDADVDAARRALEHTLESPRWAGADRKPKENWKALLELANRLLSVQAADAVWHCMAAAPTGAEATRRREAFDRLQACTQFNDHAIPAYEALARYLGPDEPIAGPLAEMEKLVQDQGGALAAQNWTVTHESQHLTEPERRLMQAVLGHARDSEGLGTLWDLLKKPVADESFGVRAEALRQALDTFQDLPRGLDVYASMGRQFNAPSGLASDAPAFAALVSMFAQRGRGALGEAESVVTWLRNLRVALPEDDAPAPAGDGSGDASGLAASAGDASGPAAPAGDAPAPAADPNATPLADLITAFTSHLMMGADTEKAKALVRGEEQRKRRERQGTDTPSVQIGDQEVVIGGVRVRVRKPGANPPS